MVAHDVLQALSTGDAPITLSELARRLKLTIPRVYRHLMTLTALGLVEKTGEEPSYQLGWQIVRLGERAVRQHDLTHIAYPHLKMLRDALRQTTMLTRSFGDEAVVWLSLDSGQVPDIVVPPGTRLPLHATASGRTLRLRTGSVFWTARSRLTSGLDPLPTPPSSRHASSIFEKCSMTCR